METNSDTENIHGWVYGLYCPLSGDLKYIGKTTNIVNRAQSHQYATPSLKKNNIKLYEWFKLLNDQGIKPQLEILHVCKNYQEYSYYEGHFIRENYSKGHLLNHQIYGAKRVYIDI